jgi:hypothetical protein
MDFVHLHDMFVMFDDFRSAAASAKFAESKASGRECWRPPGVQTSELQCRIIAPAIRRDA